MKKTYRIFADYHQFYLLDKGRAPAPPTDYTDLDVRRMVKVAPGVLVVQPVRNMTVPVTVEILAVEPADAFDAWDQVVDASLDLSSGRLGVEGLLEEDAEPLAVAPGPYRARVFLGGLGLLGWSGLDGLDHYRIVLWPAPMTPVCVLKHYAPPEQQEPERAGPPRFVRHPAADDAEFPCPACGFPTFGGMPGTHEICAVCGWEDDAVQLAHPALAGGANAPSLVAFQRRWLATGPARVREHAGRARVPGWRPLVDDDLVRRRSMPLYYWQDAPGP